VRYVHLSLLLIGIMPACQQILGIEPGELAEGNRGRGGTGGAIDGVGGMGGDGMGGDAGSTKASAGGGPNSGGGGSVPDYYVFVSQAEFLPGDELDIGDADAICAGEAAAASQVLPRGTYVAWLSIAGQPAIDRLPKGVRWAQPSNGTTIFDDAATSPFLPQSYLTSHADGSLADVGAMVYTGTDSTGQPTTVDCAMWGDGTSLVNGTFGLVGETNSQWTNAGNQICTQPGLLYCFQTDFSSD
jgi:hypothetical protein